MRWTSSPGRQLGSIEVHLKVLVPVESVVDEAALDVLLPQRRTAIDTQAVEAEAVDADLRRKTERGPQVLLGLVGNTDDEEAVDDLDAGGLGVGDRRFDLLEGLILLETVEDLLAAALDAEHDRAAPGLRELGKEVLRHRIDTALEPVFNRILGGDEAVANRLDALGLEQEVVIHEVDRAVTFLPQLLELGNDVGRSPRPPLALVEDRDVAEHARPRTAARRLHRGEAIQRQHGRDIERHRLDEVERQALAVGKGPLVEIARQRPVRVVAEGAVLLLPGDASHRVGIVQVLEQVDDELLAVAPAHEVDFLALRLDQWRVQRREHPAERQLDVGIGRAQLPRQDLGVGIARGRQEAHADEVRLLPPQLVDDDRVRRVGIGLIEHRDLVAGALEHRGEGHDADRWKSHDLQAAVRRPRLPWDGVKLRIANVDQEGSHELRQLYSAAAPCHC